MNQYNGFNNSFTPGYNQPFNQCGCGAADACGGEHQAAVKIEKVKMATGTGQVKEVQKVVQLGSFYTHVNQIPFSVWDGSLALNDLYGPNKKPYRPPAIPYVCDRPVAGSALCSASLGKSPCDP
jgi:hypothetical protein